jgi:hypothetical protein
LRTAKAALDIFRELRHRREEAYELVQISAIHLKRNKTQE